MRRMNHSSARPRSALFVAVLATACGNASASEPPPEYPPSEALPSASAPTTAEPVAGPMPVEAPPPAQLVEGTNTPIDGPAPALRITAPRPGTDFVARSVGLRLALRNWTLAPDPGNHVHVIIDNEPYIAVRDVSQPIDLVELFKTTFSRDLADGAHFVRVFPSRPTHESVKVEGNFATTWFTYRNARGGTRPTALELDSRAPLLTFSRPKGENAGTPVLLDFYVTNAILASDSFKVRCTVDGAVVADIASWVPHHLTGLAAGEHSITLALVGADGAEVPGPFNSTTRTFSIAAATDHTEHAH